MMVRMVVRLSLIFIYILLVVNSYFGLQELANLKKLKNKINLYSIIMKKEFKIRKFVRNPKKEDL